MEAFYLAGAFYPTLPYIYIHMCVCVRVCVYIYTRVFFFFRSLALSTVALKKYERGIRLSPVFLERTCQCNVVIAAVM